MSEPSSHTPALVELCDVSVVRDGKVLLEDINLAIHPSELVSIVGPNGGGKTTLMKLIVGSISPSTGTVARQAKLHIGYQPQRSRVAWHIPLTVRDLLHTANGNTAIDQGLDLLASFSLKANILGRQVTSLSGGERQCVMIVRAMLKRPDLLALDEPGTYCDQRNLSEMYARIENWARELGCATVIVSHDISRVLAHSGHVYCINKRLVCEGGPDHVVQDTEFEALYGEAGHTGIYRHRH